MPKNKFNAQKCEHDGQAFRSNLERDVYATLKLMERAGEIKDIRREQPISLTPSISHKLDFTAIDKFGELFGIEAKGFDTEGWLLKKRLYKDFSPFRIEIWKVAYRGRIGCAEIIRPGKWKIIPVDHI